MAYKYNPFTKKLDYYEPPATIGSGEANIGSNLGSGEGIYAGKGGITLSFKSLTEGSTKVNIVSSATEVSIDIDESNIVHDNISGSGTNTHTQIDSHISDASLHFTEGSIDHTNITNIGSNTHTQIDSHISDATKHREINDSGTTATDLWSADKIGNEIDASLPFLNPRIVFKEQFTGNGVATTFQLDGTLLNGTFTSGSWAAGNILNTHPSNITATTKIAIYDSANIFTRNRISITSISTDGLVTLSHAPLAVDFYVWYWYEIQDTDIVDEYYREDFIASMEAVTQVIATGVPVNTGSFGGILGSGDDEVQAALDTLDDHGHAHNQLTGLQGGTTDEYYHLTLEQNTVVTNTTNTNTGDQIALTVPNTPSGNIIATNVQAAINELDTEKLGVSATAAAVEGSDVLSTGEVGGTKFLREDGDGTCSWQTIVAGSGDVSGPSSAVDSNIALFDSTTGKLIKDGLVTVSTDTNTFNLATGTASLDIAAGATLDVNYNLTVSGASSIDQNVTTAGTPSFSTVTATTFLGDFDTNVAAAGLTLSGTTLAADGTDAAIDITITPKGNAGVVLPNAAGAPSVTTSKLYQTGGVLYFDGVNLEANTTTFAGLTDGPGGYTNANALYTTNGTPDAVIETTVILTEAANTFNITKGSASLDIAAGSALDVNANLTVSGESSVNQDLTTTASPTFVSLTSLDYIDFDLAPSLTHQEGRMHWDANHSTIAFCLSGNNVHALASQNTVVKVRNISGTNIKNGEVVYITGSDSNLPTIDLADNTDGNKLLVLGFAAEDIDTSANGWVMTSGVIVGTVAQPIDTSSYTEGDTLYLNSSGTWTGSHPTSSTYATIILGVVRKQHASEGEIYINKNLFTIGNNFNGTMRQSIINESTGTSSAAGFTAVNDQSHWMTIGIGGSNNSVFGEAAIFYGPGYADNLYAVDGNKSHKWYNDPTDSHNNSSLSYLNMELSASGNLTLPIGDLGTTGTRVKKGWFTDLEVTNAIAGSITGNAATVTTIAGLAPNTATTQATQPNITSMANMPWTGMKTGTDGDIPTFNSDGDPVFISVGTAGQVLTSNGPGAAATFQSIHANTALSNLASVAINTSLISDTDNTDALGSAAISWSDLFLGNESVITWSTSPSTPDITLTHSANSLAFSGGTIVLGVATATGGLTGDVTGNVSGSSGSCTGNSATATSLTGGTGGSIPYQSASGVTAMLSNGTSGQVLTSNGGTSAPTWETVSGSGDVIKEGTPVDGQVGVWTGDGTIEGHTSFTYDRSNLQLTGDIGSTGTRITKGWFIDLQVTNAIAGSITGNAATATSLTGGSGGSIPYQSAAGVTAMLANGTAGYVLTSAGGTDAPVWSSSGAGDMVLASIQSVTGLKTFDPSKFAMKGSSTGVTTIATANTSATDYTQTLQARDGTIANLDNITYIGTTSITLSRSSGALTLAGITLTTPDIGTPSAGTLTNCTFPTLNQNTTGNAATVTNATFTTALTVDTGTVGLTGNVANNSVLTLGAGASSISGSNTGDQTASTVLMEVIGTPTYDNIQDWSNNTQSAGVINGGVITDGGLGTVDISAVSGIIKTTDSNIGANVNFDLAGTTALALTDNITNYIAVDYNAGTPQFTVSTTNTANGHTIFNLGKVYREGTVLDIIDSGLNVYDVSKRIQQHNIERDSLHFVSGALVSETGTRNISITAGVMYAGLNRIITTAIDTNVADDFEYYYYNGAAWIESDQTQIDNTQYNNIATGLATLSNNKYGVHWVYKGTNSTTYVVYGQGNYSLAEAQAAQPPASLPDHVLNFGVLRAKIIIEKSDTSFTEIDSVDDVSFSSFTPSAHNVLTGLQGGTANEYYHLTSAQHVISTQAASTSVSGYLTATDWNTFNNKAETNQTMYIGTTAVAINRSSGALTLAGITLTTPDIGTPSAGTLTNCTFPTLNQNTTGSSGSCTGNAATVTNATLTTALTVNTGTVELVGDAGNDSVLTLGPGASSVSGSNTGDNTVCTSGTATTAESLTGGSGGTIPYQSATGVTAMLANGTVGQVLTSAGGTDAPTWETINAGDMILASIQSVTGLKTFDPSKLAMKGSSTGVTTIATANAGATDYTQTLQARNGTIANLDNVTYIGTTSVALNRTSGALTLAGITLTTPDIGTPSAGTLTNCTFPTLNQNTTGNAATVTNATLTTALTVTTGTVQLIGNVANTSVLTLDAGASSISGSNTGDNAPNSSSTYIGTTAVALNRSSGALTLAGITLTTPDIGTPSAGTLTNCTFPTLNQNTTGSSGSCTGNAATVTNATLTTALTVNTGTVDLVGNVANSSVLTLGAGASSISGTNTGDNAPNSSSTYIGTTEVALNRSSGALTLAGITLTTPNIGTPSAGTLTNCTGLPVSGLANGTDGELITWDTDGVPTTVSVGTDGYVLTSNGAGAIPTFEALALIGADTDLSNLASVAINTTLVSDTDNTDALGTAAIAWSDLFLGNESVITWSTAPSTSDVTLTHSANTLTFAGGTIALGTATATGGITGNITGNASGSSGSCTGNAATATSLTGGAGGSIPYQSAAGTTAMLSNGTVGQVLTSAGGTDAPTWSTVSGTGDVTAAASMTDNTIVRGDGGSKGVQDTGISIDDTDHVTAVETLGYASAYAIGNSSTAFNLTLSNGQHQTLTLTGNCAMTIVDTGNIGDGQWTVTCTQGGVGSFAITSASVSGGTVKVEGGTDPEFSTAVGAVDTMVVKKEGTIYYIQVAASDWQTWT